MINYHQHTENINKINNNIHKININVIINLHINNSNNNNNIIIIIVNIVINKNNKIIKFLQTNIINNNNLLYCKFIIKYLLIILINHMIGYKIIKIINLLLQSLHN